MPEALKCPSCSAPLDYPTGGGLTMRCPYCNTTVMVPGNPPASTSDVDFTAALGPVIGKALEMSQVADLLGLQTRYGRQTHRVEFAHRHLVHQSGGMEAFGRFMNRGHHRTTIMFCFFHGVTPQSVFQIQQLWKSPGRRKTTSATRVT